MTLNFVTKLSKLSNLTTRQFYDMIMTIVNELIKYAKFILYKTTLSAKKINLFASQSSFCKTRHIKENYFRSRQITHLKFHTRTNYFHRRKSKNVDRVSFKNERSNKTNELNIETLFLIILFR